MPCLQPDLHECIKCTGCKEWYHRGCITAPDEAWADKETVWKCPLCISRTGLEYPFYGGTVRVGKKTMYFVHTCTIDNFLAILHHANKKTDHRLREDLMQGEEGSSYFVIGEMLASMEEGNFNDAKYRWATHISLKPDQKGIFNFYGELEPIWHVAFGEVFAFDSCCSSNSCDLGKLGHKAGAYSFDRFIGSGRTLQEIMDGFLSEYVLPCSESAAVGNGTVDLTRTCSGMRRFSSKKFTGQAPILFVNVNGVISNAHALPSVLNVLGTAYTLAGIVQHRGSHFTGFIINSDGSRRYYDGADGVFDKFSSHHEFGLSSAVYVRSSFKF